MLDALKNLIAGNGEASSDALRRTLDEAHDAIRAKAAEIATLKSARGERILEATDAELDDLEAQIRAGQRQLERLELAAERLDERLPLAEQAEAEAERERKRQRAAELDEAMAKDVAAYEKLAARLATVLQRMKERAVEREALPGDCEAGRVPGWRDGHLHTPIFGTRSYGVFSSVAARYSTVQLPSLARREPHWGDLPSWARAPVKEVKAATEPVPGYADHVGEVDPETGFPVKQPALRGNFAYRAR